MVVSGTCDNCLLLQSGDTPLHCASRVGHYDVCLSLLKNGADMKIKNKVIFLLVCYIICDISSFFSWIIVL